MALRARMQRTASTVRLDGECAVDWLYRVWGNPWGARLADSECDCPAHVAKRARAAWGRPAGELDRDDRWGLLCTEERPGTGCSPTHGHLPRCRYATNPVRMVGPLGEEG